MSGATARPAGDASPSPRGVLRARAVSAAVLAPPVLAVVWVGWPWFEAMVSCAAGILAREWWRLCGCRGASQAGILLAVAVVAPVIVAATGRFDLALAAAAAGAAVVVAVGRGDVWSGAGALYIAIPCLAFVWLGADAATGRMTVLWLLAAVWAADVGAYGFGRVIGGPRLAPALSPNKTWAGFAGAVVCAAAASVAFAAVAGAGAGLTIVLTGAAIGAAAQAGDLVESAAKRHFGVKDTGGLIPGHGGLLDRVDGLMAASVVAALIVSLGIGSIGTWT